ncbi:MAG: DMT family transporter [Alphaproteobacteria bacterium]|nr:DMT family transporter [Alphaproteobacteria bacterium]
MLDSLLWGALAAFLLGTSDFLARFTSLRLGAVVAYTYVVVFGALLMTAFIFATGAELRFNAFGTALAAVHGLFVAAMSLMLYAALARGPISLAVPIVAAHPVLILLYDFAIGASQLLFQQTLAAAIVVLGVIAASLFSFHGNGQRQGSTGRGGTLLLALGACFAYALLIVSGQAAAAEIGQISATWLGRLTSAAILLLALAFGVFKLRRPAGSAPTLMVQGLLDTLGYVALLAGGLTHFPSITAVLGSCFGFLTIVLARLIIKEKLRLGQWIAVMVSFGGIAWLAYGQ